MALRENAAGGGPVFADPRVPCLQLLGLQASVEGGGALSVSTYQDDDYFGLRPCREARFEDGARRNGICRWRPLAELPVGPVAEVAVLADQGVIAEVCLRLGQRPLLLVAGELEETWEGRLIFRRLDESVLAFTDPAAAEDVPWTTSRRGLAPIDC